MSKLTIKFKTLILGIVTAIFSLLPVASTYAIGQFAVSPMYQLISLTPGETYVGNFEVVNPADHEYDFYYEISVEPFTTSDNDALTFTASGDYNRILDWIEIYNTSGVIAPNETAEIRFAIHVPEDAPAGGQYVALTVSSAQYRLDNNTADIRQTYAASHLIYADVSGETVRKGEINDVKVPGFLFSGNITGSSNIKNAGNVHSQATQTMQIFPLFSNEEIYTNEEQPKKSWIMPEATNYSSIEWKETPSVGIFHVIYNVEYEGVESKVDKMVIVCPIWLLFLILLAIFLIIFRILSAKKKEKK